MTHQVQQLPDWTEGTTHLVMQVPWVDENGEEVDLTGATITGLLQNTQTKASRAIAGTLQQNAETDHYMDWTLTGADAVAGKYAVQFTAVFDDKPLRTFRARWYVEAAIPEPSEP